MNRFFVKNKIDENTFELDENILKHIKVARLKNENFYCNYQGKFYVCKLENNNATILEEVNINHEYKNEVVLAAPIIKIPRFEWMLEKAVELGVTKIIPTITQYTDGSLVKYDLPKKYQRHCEIVKNAAEQSFRNIIPQLTDPQKIADVLNEYQSKNIYIAHEKASENRTTVLKTNSIIFIGPEGGFSDEEIALAEQFGAKTISLGKTILRAETAAICALSKIDE
ncbi:16S rRNA (uracil(1498)-N(3))-methyltransferase [Mycoplasmopsis iners]|uniref:16S rRNA (uracil(1498)-N(3))-methyltransferase n=1 Tax=Mycoplasmopsis iners TaxID=76630 RepID=UPI000494E123|nr:16S rRNA (uracil(1498)-N(3))-methyltransferase [Mycoplasmopsis iners]